MDTGGVWEGSAAGLSTREEHPASALIRSSESLFSQSRSSQGLTPQFGAPQFGAPLAGSPGDPSSLSASALPFPLAFEGPSFGGLAFAGPLPEGVRTAGTAASSAEGKGSGASSSRAPADGSVRYDAAWLAALEAKVAALLARVYGEGHVAVQASFADAPSVGKRPAVSVAVAIDARVATMPVNADVVRAEQNRLGTLVSHAAGLDTARGDSLAVSFLLFTDEDNTLWIAVGGAVLVALFLALALLLRRKRPGSRPDGRQGIRPGVRSDGSPGASSGPFQGADPGDSSRACPDGRTSVRNVTSRGRSGVDPERGTGGGTDPSGSGPERGRHGQSASSFVENLAGRLAQERPQVRAVVLACLEPATAAAVLVALPPATRVETVACLALQGHVEEDVLALVTAEFLSGADAAGASRAGGGRNARGRAGTLPPGSLFASGADPGVWTNAVLRTLPGDMARDLRESACRLSRRAGASLNGS